MIPLLRKSTSRAVMPTVREVLSYLLTAGACLACAFGINGHELNTSFFGFVLQNVKEAAPGDIRDCPAQLAVLEHPLDVQAFRNEETEGFDQTAGDLIVVLAPAVDDVSMDLLQANDGFAATIASLISLAGYRPLGAAKFRQRFTQVSRVGFRVTVAAREKMRQAHIDAYARQITRLDRNVWKFAGEDDEPFAGFSFDPHRLNLAFDGPMHLDADRADVLNIEAIPV